MRSGRKNFNERCRINNLNYRKKKRDLSETIKPRGRPRKPIPIIITADIPI